MSSSGVYRTYILYIYIYICRLLFLFVRVYTLKKMMLLFAISLSFALSFSVSVVLSSVIVVLSLSEGDRRETERAKELYHFTLFFIYVCVPLVHRLTIVSSISIHTYTHSYTDVIGDRSIKNYTHIHSFTCPSIALDLVRVSSSHI